MSNKIVKNALSYFTSTLVIDLRNQTIYIQNKFSKMVMSHKAQVNSLGFSLTLLTN